ncbi:MAG TPA: hypothetical protein VGK10_05265 [Prolixibacteraceae bacterium]|jgi:hypothetical protein
MNQEAEIPIPIRFNSFKHHRDYILEVLKTASPELIASLLDPLCNNYIDIYSGTLTPEAIFHQVIDILQSNQVFQPDDFTSWVDTINGYRQITLVDQSEWVLRKSNEEERYIHLHPARTGPFSMRFKGSTLKTVWMLKTNSPSPQHSPSLEKVNQLRIQIGLSPVKKLDRSKGILNCYEKFFLQD